jgi:ankyrin repeat protein
MNSPRHFRDLIEACKNKNRELFYSSMERLYTKGSTTIPEHTFGNSPLHYCYEHGYIEGVQMLMAAGHNAHLSNRVGETPLHAACEHRQYDLVRWHLDNNSLDSDYEVLDLRSGYSPSMWLVSNGNLALFQEFLIRGYVNIELESSFRKNTHFTLAIQMGHADIVWFLWKNGLQGKLGVFQQRNESILIHDVLRGVKHPERIFNVLKKIGCFEAMITDINTNEVSPLEFCIKNKRTKAFAYIVKEGLARPSTDLDVFRNITSHDRKEFIDELLLEISKYQNFVQGFLPITAVIVRSDGSGNFKTLVCKTKKLLTLQRFTAGINEVIASFAGVPYGKVLVYLKETVALIESFQ